ncbi:MAG TPA: type II toxin-antitoxin system RelE/ParE family toxin [Rubrivivax sp.]|nr:type II toxin-antitoxin system RelE/ParE family toxin [Rubrivivax sp.]
MTRITLATQGLHDIDRIFDFLIEHEAADAGERVADIVVALDVLTRNPMIGRPVEAPFRELVIGRGPGGYVALYRYAADDDAVHVVGVRGQRDAGFSGV